MTMLRCFKCGGLKPNEWNSECPSCRAARAMLAQGTAFYPGATLNLTDAQRAALAKEGLKGWHQSQNAAEFDAGFNAGREPVDDGSAAHELAEGIGIAKEKVRLGNAVWTKIYNGGGFDHRLQADKPEPTAASAELRPPPEHEGKPLHWVEWRGEPTAAMWSGNWWHCVAGDRHQGPPDYMAKEGYRYLSPAEWPKGGDAGEYWAERWHETNLNREQLERDGREIRERLTAQAEQIGALICERDQLRRENAELQAAVRQLADQLVAAPIVSHETPAAFPANALKHST